MIIAKTEPEALASGAESIVRDGDVWRCYMPGEIQRPEPPPEVPVVSMRAFRLALSQMGWRQEVAEFLKTAPIEVVDSFETAPRVARYDPMVLGATAALKKTEAQADELFVVAKEIEATL